MAKPERSLEERILDGETYGIPEAKRDIVLLCRGLRDLYSYKDWQKIDNKKVMHNEHRAERIRKALYTYEDRIKELEDRIAELESKATGGKG